MARQLGVSVRTLHHWHQSGVAAPSGRTSGGHRTYSATDVARLRRVLLLRDLGVPLRRIPALLEAGSVERRDELERRRRELTLKILHLQSVDQEVERLLAAEMQGVLMPVATQARIFGDRWDPQWTAQAREQWGDSAQWAEYTERSASRTENDWRNVASSMEAVTAALVEAKREGVVPGSERANAVAEEHREALSEYFHCTHSMHVLIAVRYEEEPGLCEYYEQVEPGLASWLKQVIDANACAQGVDPATAVWQ